MRTRVILLLLTALAAGTGYCVTPDPPKTPSTTGEERKEQIETKPGKEPEKTTETKTGHPYLFPPLGWGCEDEWKLQFGGQTRLRMERRDNFDMKKEVGDNDNLGFLRTKLNFDLTYRQFVRAFLEILDAREIDSRIPRKQEDKFDLHQLFLEIHDKKVSPWGVRLGRQEMQYGEKRLVETSSWSNLIRTYTGARLFYKTKEMDLNAFLMQPDIYNTKRGDMILTDRKRFKQREWFYGFYNTFYFLDPHEFDLYFLGLSDLNDHRTFPSEVKSERGEFGTTDRYTVGTRWRGLICEDECGKLGYGFEGAYQFGHKSNDDIRAYMLHADLNYQWEHPWKPKVFLLGNLASGDRRHGDGETNTFSPLFGSTHTPYGLIDFTRLQNLRELAVTGSVEPTKKLRAQIEFHQFWLDSKTDAWYNSSGSKLGRDTKGRSGRNLGQEIDLVLAYKHSKNLTFEAGAAHFIPGNFAKKVGRNDRANFFYIQTVFNF